MNYPKSELIFGAIIGGVIAVIMEILVFAQILIGIVRIPETGIFLQWVDQVFIAAWTVIFLMALLLYSFSLYHLKGAINGKNR